MNDIEIKNIKEKHSLLITSLNAIAKENPEYLPMVLTDFNLMLVLNDLDEKLSKYYTFYLNNKNRVLLDPSSSGLQKSLMQMNGTELLDHYFLYQIYYKIALDRNLDIYMRTNIKDIERICLLDGPKLLKKRN